MTKHQIILDFGAFSLEAELFNTSIAQKFKQSLPYQVRLMQWGNELYGSPKDIKSGFWKP